MTRVLLTLSLLSVAPALVPASRAGGQKRLAVHSDITAAGGAGVRHARFHGEGHYHIGAAQHVSADAAHLAATFGSRGSSNSSITPASGSGSATVVTHESWFQRMGNALFGVLIGIIMIWFSIPCMWINERRNARMEAVISCGKAEVQAVAADKANPELRGALVFVEGAVAKAPSSLQDSRFPNVRSESGCLRLRSTVEVLQWRERSESKTNKDSLGGSERTEITYTYSQAWASDRIESDGFRQSGHQNKFPEALDLGSQTENCKCADLGESFLLSEDLVKQFDNWQTESQTGFVGIGKSFVYRNNLTFYSSDDGYYYHPTVRAVPEIGDTRVTFEYVLDGPASVLALQAEAEAEEHVGKGREVFLPYRMVSRGMCGISKEVQQERQLVEGKKDPGDLYNDDKCDLGPLSGLCCCCTCACNVVTFICSSLTTPELYHLIPGKVSLGDAWEQVAMRSAAMKWIMRIGSWLLLFWGTFALFKPLEVMLDIVPFLGPYLGTFASYAIWFLCFVVTLAVATFIIALAYLVYHPLLALLYFAVGGAVVAGVSFLAGSLAAKA